MPGPEGPQSDSAAIDLPGLGGMVRHAWPHILEGAVLPTIVFYIALWLTDVWGALIAATAWSYLGLIRRTFSKSRVGGLLLLTALTLTVRLAISALSGSPLVYFLQPAVAKLAVGVGLVASLGSAEPMLQRLTGDVVPMSSEISSRPCVRRFFKRAAIAWALVLAGHAAFGVWLLFSVSIHSYVAIKMVANFVVKGGAVAGSMWWFRRRTA